MDDKTKRKLQRIEIDILDEIVRVCEKHDIKYYLAGGTLLGAVRHGGFIPWDDDIDISMPREEYNIFKEICKKELDGKYFLQNHESESKYWYGISHVKVRKNGTLFEESWIEHLNDVHKGIFVDIFILDHVKKKESILQDIQAILLNIFMNLYRYKQIGATRKMFFKYEFILFIILLASFFKAEHLIKLQKLIISKNFNLDYEYYVNFGSPYGHKKTTISKKIYDPPKKIKFEGKFYNAPNDWHNYLKCIYGDYMKLPPKDKRVRHNISKVIVK